MTLELIAESVEKGLPLRTVQRWKKPGTSEDCRCGPRTQPANRLSDAERRRVLEVANSEEFRELSPKQIVPRLADRGEYIASESTFFRELRDAKQLAPRGKAKAPAPRPRPELEATAPNQVCSWDITYLRSTLRGAFFYLYLVVDVHSRRVVSWDVHAEESSELAATLMRRVVEAAGHSVGLRLYSDNGAPMKGSTLLATLQTLGVVRSFSRPRVSDDNPFSEALFRTLKYRPCFPDGPFASLEAARARVATFVDWHNGEHRHSGIRFVTPDERHFGREAAVLEKRHRVYERARRREPSRWSGTTRDGSAAGPVRLGVTPREKEIRLSA